MTLAALILSAVALALSVAALVIAARTSRNIAALRRIDRDDITRTCESVAQLRGTVNALSAQRWDSARPPYRH